MVRIVATFVLLAAVAVTAADASTPPLRLTIVADPAITQDFIRDTLTETEAIWRDAGIAIEWHRGAGAAVPTPLDVVVTLETGATVPKGGGEPLGWIRFEGIDAPTPDIHLSLANAVDLIDRTASLHANPEVLRERLLARALGRALAHELGHYLLRSRAHAARGLMLGTRPSTDFFTPERHRFAIQPDDRRWLIAHFGCPDTDWR